MKALLSPEKRRWFIVAIIFLAIVFNYVDRQIVSILKPVLKLEIQFERRWLCGDPEYFYDLLCRDVSCYRMDGGQVRSATGNVLGNCYLVIGLHWWRYIAHDRAIRIFPRTAQAAEPDQFSSSAQSNCIMVPR